MTESTVPGTLVKLGLSGIRLPLTIAQRAGERSGLDLTGLPPIALYDSVEARAKQVLGRFLGDRDLLVEGERQETAVRYRLGAQSLEDAAHDARQAAAERLEDRVGEAEETLEQVEKRTAEERARIEQEEEAAKARARERARKREAAARQAAQTRKKAAEAKERQAQLAQARAEAQAVEKQADAVEAEKIVTAIDEHLEARKTTRRKDSD